MYRPPENCNRVKSIKSKFENLESNSERAPRPAVARQLSDPNKRNIKRTPAFRLDRNAEKSESFQRNAAQNRSHYEMKVKQFNSVLKNNCDNNNKNVIGNDSTELTISLSNNANIKSLIKSKSSHDFQSIRRRFDDGVQEENQRSPCCDTTDSTDNDVSLLYTEPIPKLLRVKSCDKHVYSNVPPEIGPNQQDIYNSETLKVGEKPVGDAAGGLTDTLKTALKRPLPTGPAPKKPPRTFVHTPPPPKNPSFLHLTKELEKKLMIATTKPKTKTRGDPKYMLSKLENALRNNKLRARKQIRTEISTTSGEDSDDSLLFRSKTKRNATTATMPTLTSQLSDTFNFNCLNGFSCSTSPYERIKEPNSTFFVSCKAEEPVYAEPFHFRRDEDDLTKPKTVRNSLYYMSTSLLNDEKRLSDNMDKCHVKQNNEVTVKSNKQISDDTSSLSSFTSDLDSTTSTPLDEVKTFESTVKIKNLISTFEERRNGPDSTDGGTSSRVEDLKMSLQKTLDRCFSNTNGETATTTTTTTTTGETVDQIINKFETYVKTMPKYQRPKSNLKDTLFYCVMIVEYNRVAQIKFKYPNHVDVPHKIEELCFPEATSGPLDCSNNAQCYSLVITNDRGERHFGYCRRVMPEGSMKSLPLAYCILSKHRAPRFYKKILAELESRHGIANKLRDELISDFYHNKFPKPGESLKINVSSLISGNNRSSTEHDDTLDLNSFVTNSKTGHYGSLNKVKMNDDNSSVAVCGDDVNSFCNSTSIIERTDEKLELILTMHHDSRYEEADLKPLHTLPSNILIKLFSSLLLERKVVLISCVISKLSCCVDALQSILYPFTWPHTFIPILPECLWDVVESPTPVICGILSVAVVNKHIIENAIVVDLDVGIILQEERDEDRILSSSMQKVWKKGLELANSVSREDYVHSVYLNDAYMQVFIVGLKHYKNFIVDGIFQKENFIRSAKTKGVQRFLKWFTETAMFLSFIDAVIVNPDSFTLFDRKIEMYGSEQSGQLLSKLLDWKK